MALTIVGDTADDLPEGLRAAAKTANGKFVVDALPTGWGLEDITQLRKALQDERHGRGEAEKRAKMYEGIDDPAAARDALEKMKSGSLKSAKDIDDWKKSLEDKVAADLRTKDELLSASDKQIRELMFSNAARDALAKHGGQAALLLPLIEKRTQFVRVDGKVELRIVGDDGKELLTKKTGSTAPMGVEEFVLSLKAKPEYAAAFTVTAPGGSGSNHTAGGSGQRGPSATNLTPEQKIAQHIHSRFPPRFGT